MQPFDAATLVRQLSDGEPAAFEVLVRTFGPRLLAVARRYVATEEAQDCFQEAMVAALAKIDTLRDPAMLYAWLKRIVINCALMRIRGRASRREESLDDLLPVFDDRDCRIEPDLGRLPNPEELLDSAESRQIVRDAIRSLPENHRTILMLRDFEGYTTDDTAKQLGIEYGTAKVRLHRARAALKKLLEPLMTDGTL